MNFDSYVAKQSPPPESSFRPQKSRFDSKAGDTDDQLKGEVRRSAKDARRRRVNLRRIRSISQAKSAADLSSSSRTDVGLKKGDLAPEEDASERGISVRRRPYGKISVVGRRREMENIVSVELGFLKRGDESYDFFGIMNCHGGWRMVHTCGDMLHEMLAKIVEEKEDSKVIDWEAVIAAWFDKMEAKVNQNRMVSTAVIVVVGDNEMVVANCGSGSRAVLSRGGVAVQLSPDDQNLNPLVVTETEVRVISRIHAEDEFLILGSGGLWDVIPKELACLATSRYFHVGMRSGCHFSGGGDVEERNETRLVSESGGAEAAAALLAELAMVRGTRENISIIVVDLKS